MHFAHLTVLLGALAAPVSDQGGASPARAEVVADFSRYLSASGEAPSPIRLERISTAVPWPRGLVVVGDDLVALARGRHRNAGGIDPSIPDRSGALFLIDPDVFEPVIRSEAAGEVVRGNARVLAEPDPSVFHLFDPSLEDPSEAVTIDRPYCTLAYDPLSQNFFICGYSGVDLPGKRFRKNGSDSILRYDLRNRSWRTVEQHDPAAVPTDELDYVVPNTYYPHHDPTENAPPHGWLNGPDGAAVVGRYLYAVGKDNHSVVRYELDRIRADAQAPPPDSRQVMGAEVDARLTGPDGTVQRISALGASALESRDGFLYVGYRTSSIVLRFPVDGDGALIEPVVGELIAAFTPWDADTQLSGNLIDLAFSPGGELFASLAERGRVWNMGHPDPARPFDGIDEGDDPTANQPYVDLPALTGNPRARCGNIVFDDEGRLYMCSGNYENGTVLAGVIYRAVPQD